MVCLIQVKCVNDILIIKRKQIYAVYVEEINMYTVNKKYWIVTSAPFAKHLIVSCSSPKVTAACKFISISCNEVGGSKAIV